MKLRISLIMAMLLLLLLSTTILAAPVDQQLPYQKKVTASPGTGNVSCTFSLYDMEPVGQGTQLWFETKLIPMTSMTRLIPTTLGDTVPFSSMGIDFSEQLWVQVDCAGQTIGTRDKLTAVPYALWSGQSGVPRGGIIMWSGSASQIPDGWALCNGQNGTPDLRDKFVIGAGNAYAVGASGGTATINLSHSHIVNDHTHGFSGNSDTTMKSKKTRNEGNDSSFELPPYDHHHHFSGTTGGASDRGTSSALSASQSILPPFYAVAFIMKL